MLSNRRGLAAATLLLAAVGLAGCGGGSGDSGTSHSSHAADGLTAPGTTLKVGDTATVAGRDGAEVVDLTVASIEPGDRVVLKHLAHSSRYTPYYVHYRARLVSGDVTGAALLDSLTAWSGDTAADSLTTTRPAKQCEAVGFPLDARTGATADLCVIYLTSADGPPIDKITYDNGRQYLEYKGTNLTWK